MSTKSHADVVVKIRALPPTLREKLKSPLGRLIRGPPNKTMLQLKKLIEKEHPSKIISVGDVVSGNMTKYSILPHLAIVDNKSVREPIKPIYMEANQTLYLKNPPGTLVDEAWALIKGALEQKLRTKIVIDGEEDLLTLVVVLCASEGSFVVYGQPQEGIVVIKVTRRKKEIVRRIVDAMEDLSKN